MKLVRAAITAAAASALALAVAPPVNASTVIARWEMNEGTTAQKMLNDAGSGLDGTIGTTVQTGVTVLGRTGYRFPLKGRLSYDPARLVTVPDAGNALDPGTRTYTIKWRMRFNTSYGNILQKGQSGTPGGYFKVQAPRGVVQCLFRDGTGFDRTVSSGRPLNDDRWHYLKCTRSSTAVTMTVDGVLTSTSSGAVGDISNDYPLSIGGKYNCNQTSVSCDYFVGDLDRVEIKAS